MTRPGGVYEANGWRRSCRTKRRFFNQAAALATVKAEEWQREGTSVEVRPYKCPCCPGWHLTSKKARP